MGRLLRNRAVGGSDVARSKRPHMPLSARRRAADGPPYERASPDPILHDMSSEGGAASFGLDDHFPALRIVGPPDHRVSVADHIIETGPIRVWAGKLEILFTVTGPEASARFPKVHVVVIRSGDTEKLQSLGGTGGSDEPGTAFFLWRFVWPGGDSVRLLYLDEDDVAQEHVLAL